MTLTVGSLFAGIGGIDLGLERAGMKTVWQVEIDPWCQRVLAKHWPDVDRFADVREVGAHNLQPVDVIAGGFPCQDISVAGKGVGIGGTRSGLWSEFGRLIRELRPRYVVVENVPALLGRGLHVVLGEMAQSGYDAEWDCIPAAAVGAPHLRDRIWIVATRTEQRRALADTNDGGPLHPLRAGRDASRDGRADVADASSPRLGEVSRIPSGDEGQDDGRSPSCDHLACRDGQGERAGALADTHCGRREQRDAAVRPVPVADSVGPERSDWWAAEPNVGRVAHGVPHRVDRLRGLGNAVVPQVVEWIGRRIVAYEEARVA